MSTPTSFVDCGCGGETRGLTGRLWPQCHRRTGPPPAAHGAAISGAHATPGVGSRSPGACTWACSSDSRLRREGRTRERRREREEILFFKRWTAPPPWRCCRGSRPCLPSSTRNPRRPRPPARARTTETGVRAAPFNSYFCRHVLKKLLCIQFVVSPACDGPLRRGPPRSPRCLFSQCSTCGAGTARVGSHRSTL